MASALRPDLNKAPLDMVHFGPGAGPPCTSWIGEPLGILGFEMF